MAEKLRMFGIVAVFAVFGAILYTTLSGNEEIPTAGEVVVPEFEQREAAVPEFDFDETGRAAQDEDTTADESVLTSADTVSDKGPDSQSTGSGKISVTLSISQDFNIPSNMLITLHYVPDEARFDGAMDTVFREANPDSEGKAVFDDLPLGYYVIFARSATHTGTVNRSLTQQYPDREVTLELYPAGVISGIVVNTLGEPVPDAHVFVAGYLSAGNDLKADLYRSRASAVPVDDDGAYTMVNLQVRDPALEYRLLAMAPGYAPTVTDLYPLGSSGVQIVLGKGGMVSGQVVNDTTGEAVSNVKLTASSGYALGQQETETGEQGEFAFAELVPGEYTFVVDDDELVVMSDALQLDLEEGQTIDDLRIAVMQGAIATGRVYDSDTGSGVAGVTMVAYPSNIPGASTKRDILTDSNGTFRIPGLHAGSWRIEYRDIKGYPNMNWENRKEVVTALGQTISGLDFPVSRGLYISGTVVNEKGEPITDGNVSGQLRNGRHHDSTTLDDRGSFAIYGFGPGDSARLTIRPAGYGEIRDEVDLETEPVTGLRFVAETEATISGTVVDPSGTPLNDIRIYVTPDNEFTGFNSDESDTSGKFKIAGLSQGTYHVRRSFEYSMSQSDKVLETISLAKGEHRENVRLIWEEDGDSMSISGTVLNDINEPIPRVQVYSWAGQRNIRGTTGSDGHFEVAGLPQGTANVQFQHSEHVPTNQQVEAGTKNINVTMARVGAVSGHVVDAVTREPVSSFSMLIVPGSYQTHMEQNYKSYHHAEGEFTVTGTYPGQDNELRFRAKGYAETAHSLQGVQSGETIENIIVELAAENRLTGIVVDQSNNPLSAAWIYIGAMPRQEWERERARKATTDAEGRFELGGLSSGDQTFAAFKEGFTPHTISTYIDGLNNEIKFVLGSGGTIEGLVTYEGQPVSNGNIYGNIHNAQNGAGNTSFQIRGEIENDGTFSISGIPDGQGNLTAQIYDDGENRSKSVTVAVADAQVTEANFDFVSATSAVEGYLFISETETGSGNVNLQVENNGQTERRWKEVGSDGYFLFEKVPAGNVSIQAWDQTHRRNKRVTGQVGDNETLRLDLHMYGGGDVVVNVTNAPQGTLYAAIVSRDYPIPETPSEQVFQELSSYMLAQTQILNGTGKMSAVEAGNHNLMVVSYTIVNNTVDWATSTITSTPVTVTDGEEVTVSLSL